ncbi:MAG: phosphoribosylanthranilate isomerase [Kofleriaceae bacterium]
MTKIKICGVIEPDDAARVAATGVDFLGLNFWPRSKRYLAPADAPAIAAAARAAGPALLVGVFVNAARAELVAIARDAGLDVIQLHGDEPPDEAAAIAHATGLPVWKAVAVGGAHDVDALARWTVDAILLDAPAIGRGGSGATFDWRLARDARDRDLTRRLVLAGGLGPHNVATAIAAVAPWAVDVASGVEAAPGRKDAAKVAAFVAAVRGAVPAR